MSRSSPTAPVNPAATSVTRAAAGRGLGLAEHGDEVVAALPACLTRAPSDPSVSSRGRRPAASRSSARRLAASSCAGADRQHAHLHRREPQRQPALVALEQRGGHPLHRADGAPVDHHDPLP